MGEKYHFFWKSGSPFSQWHHSQFSGTSKFGGGEEQFSCAEQWMMYNKAMLFNDPTTAKKILGTSDPASMKKLGRQVRNFNNKEWEKYKIEIVKDGNLLKFSQNPQLKEALFNTTGTLVEASPHDTIWGIGLSESDPRALRKATWRGQNLLGFILTEVRSLLQDNNNNDGENKVVNIKNEVNNNNSNGEAERYDSGWDIRSSSESEDT